MMHAMRPTTFVLVRSDKRPGRPISPREGLGSCVAFPPTDTQGEVEA